MNNTNFNEEIFEELSDLGLEGRIVEIPEEDKGTYQDYLVLEKKLLFADMETTRMIRESSRNAGLGLPCGLSVAVAVKMRQELTKGYFGIEELQRLFLKTSVVDNFTKDNINRCDTGSIPTLSMNRKIKRKYF